MGWFDFSWDLINPFQINLIYSWLSSHFFYTNAAGIVSEQKLILDNNSSFYGRNCIFGVSHIHTGKHCNISIGFCSILNFKSSKCGRKLSKWSNFLLCVRVRCLISASITKLTEHHKVRICSVKDLGRNWNVRIQRNFSIVALFA